jgi:transposase
MAFMNAYSKDLRLKVLSAIDRGIPRKEVADLFGVSLSTIKRWLKRRQAPHRGCDNPQDPR